jgi:apolipoprotein N-acyltransferase
MTEAAASVATGNRYFRLAEGIGALRGWRRAALALLLGAFATTAMPPLHWLPALMISFTGLVWMLEGAAGAWRRGFVVFVFAVGHFAAGLYWVGIAFTVEAEKFAWMIPFAVGGLSALLALFPALTVSLGWSAARRLGLDRIGRVAFLVGAWVLSEWLRSWVLTGFPWNLMGVAWTFSPTTMQAAALFGVWGLGFATLTAACVPAAFDRGNARRALAFTAIAALLLAAVAGYGSWRLESAPAPAQRSVDAVGLRLVQANVDQRRKWRNEGRRESLARYMELSAADGFDAEGPGLTHVIWPETAVTYFINEQPELQAFLRRAAPPGGLLITGAPRIERGEAGTPPQLWNSLYALSPKGDVIATYDKFHLVPFGEYVPFRETLPVEKLTYGRLDFSPGPGPRRLDLPGLPPVSPLICYEVIFPQGVVPPGPRPGFLLNLTNDAWFGTSSGPFQHFANARLRAVEQGLPLVRAANTGISAVVDGYGRIWRQLGLGESGYIDSRLPVALAPTLFSRLGSWSVALVLVAAGALALALGRRG